MARRRPRPPCYRAITLCPDPQAMLCPEPPVCILSDPSRLDSTQYPTLDWAVSGPFWAVSEPYWVVDGEAWQLGCRLPT